VQCPIEDCPKHQERFVFATKPPFDTHTWYEHTPIERKSCRIESCPGYGVGWKIYHHKLNHRRIYLQESDDKARAMGLAVPHRRKEEDSPRQHSKQSAIVNYERVAINYANILRRKSPTRVRTRTHLPTKNHLATKHQLLIKISTSIQSCSTAASTQCFSIQPRPMKHLPTEILTRSCLLSLRIQMSTRPPH
jgi:hypothetical protein